MAPDLNSISPTSESRQNSIMTNGTNRDPSPTRSPQTGSTSLQAAATMNAGLQHGEPGRRSSSSSMSQRAMPPANSGRRRSQVLMNLQIADPSTPAPGEMVESAHGTSTGGQGPASPLPIARSPRLTSPPDPRRSRAPSLGELHQELENEQEFQVNRLLQEIRRLQIQVQRQQSGQSEEAISDRSGPLPMSTSMTSASASTPTSAHPPLGSSVPRSPGLSRSSMDMARVDTQPRSSRTPSRGASPRLRATSISAESGDQLGLGGRDESSFYQAETQMLVRENQMLRHRIRELERQLSDHNGSGTSGAHEPVQPSNLTRSTSIAEDEP